MILLLSCAANKWKWETIQNLWLSHCGIQYFIIVGNGNQGPSSKEILCEFDEQNHILKIDCDDGYDGLSYKIAHAIKAVEAKYSPNFIIKIDDDVVTTPQGLNMFITTCLSTGDYCGNASQPHGDELTTYGIDKFVWPQNKIPIIVPSNSTCAGPLYFLSAKAIKILSDHMDPEFLRYEDVNVSLTLEKHGIIAKNIRVWTDIMFYYTAGMFIALHDEKRDHPQNIKK